MKYVFLSCVAIFMTLCGESTPEKIQFSKESFTSKSDYKLPYRLLKPQKIEKDEGYPLIIFLHGAGERGTDNEKQLMHIASSFTTESYQKDYPSFVIFPQCPEDGYWGTVEKVDGKWYVGESQDPSPSGQAVLDLLDDFIRRNPVDRSRIYIAGLSMGGFGTLDLVRHRPNTFAAAVSICGGGNRRYVTNYRHMPIWLFHGAKDPVVPVSLSREMHVEFKARNMDCQYTEYPEGGHDVWNEAWAEPGLLPWLFSKQSETKD